MRNGKRGWFTLEFEQEAVRLVESGQTLAAAARSLCVVEQTLGNWIKLHGVGALKGVTGMSAVVTPLVAWLAMNSMFLLWHIPGAYDFALEHEGWHAVEHIRFLSTSLLFWWCILRPWPANRTPQNWGILHYLVTADIVNTMLSAFLAFCGRPVYSFYATHANPFHVSLVDDQILGAAIMWVFGSLVFLIPAMVVAVQLAGMQSTRRISSRLG